MHSGKLQEWGFSLSLSLSLSRERERERERERVQYREVYWSMATARMTTSGEASYLRMLYTFLQSPLTFQATFQVSCYRSVPMMANHMHVHFIVSR